MNIISFGILVAMFLFTLYIGYLILVPVKVFTINSIHMTTPKVKAGSDAIYHVNYCRYFAGDIHVFKSLDGPSLVYIPETVNRNPAGCREADVIFPVPVHVLPGKYYIKVTAEAQVNQLNKVSVHYQTDAFEVIPATESGIIKENEK